MTGLGMEQGACAEYGALLRMWGRLQTEMSVLCQAHAQALKTLESEVLRLRADLLITHTALYWGMTAGRLAVTKRPLQRVAPASATLLAANEVLCRTGCEGHAHHWLDDHSGCTRTGQPCHRLTPAR